MARSKKKRPEAISGGFSAIPWAVLDGEAFQGASVRARAMLFEVIRQLDGQNNGHVNLAVGRLRKRGWKSTDAISAAKSELQARGLLIRTKSGGLNIGPDLFAVTWLNVSNFIGLEIGSHQYHRGAWRFEESLPAPKKRHTRTPKKRDDSSASRNSAVPPHGTAEASTVPPHGTKTAHSGGSAIPPHGNNVYTNHPPVECSLVRTLPAIQRFQARVGGKLSPPEREPNPLGRTRHVRLFKAAFGHLIAQADPRVTDQIFPAMRAAGWRFVGAAPSLSRGANCFRASAWKIEAARPSHHHQKEI